MAADPNATPKKSRRTRGVEVQPAEPEASWLDNALNAVFDMSPFTAASVGVTVASLVALGLLWNDRREKLKVAEKKKVGSTTGGVTPGGDGPSLIGPDGQVSTEVLSRCFAMCAQAQSGQHGAQAMQQFYSDLIEVEPEMASAQGRMIASNFLFWYYRTENARDRGERGIPSIRLTRTQSQHIHSWMSFDDSDCPMDQFQQKADLLFSVSFNQRSVPHLLRLYKYLLEHPRMASAISLAEEDLNMVARAGGSGREAGPPQDQNKDRYACALYQCACLLGDWENVTRFGGLVKVIEEDKRIRARPMSTWTSRAFEQPLQCPDYGYLMNISEELHKTLGGAEEIPPQFDEWKVLSWKLANVDPSVTDEENGDFILVDEDATVDGELIEGCVTHNFLPPNSRRTAGIPTGIKVWGRMLQMFSPVTASNGSALFPLVGSCTDSKIFAGYDREVTLRDKGGKIKSVKKSVIFNLERSPIEKDVKITPIVGLKKDAMSAFAGEDHIDAGEATVETGYVWEGTMTVTNVPTKPKSMEALWSMFMGPKPDEDGEASEKLGEPVTQTYHCELVISN